MNKGSWVFIVFAVLVVAAGFSFALFVSETHIQRIAAAAEIMLVGALVLVTIFYAKRTSDIAEATERQAEATKQAAEATELQAEATKQAAEATRQQAEATKQAVNEARKQRQDGFLPVLDIIDSSSGNEKVAIGYRLKASKLPDKLTCKFINVGVGPALHVQYQVIWDESTRTLTENRLIQGEELVPPSELAITLPADSGGLPYVQVIYRDVFGRKCKSTKAIDADFEQNRFELGYLQFEVG